MLDLPFLGNDFWVDHREEAFFCIDRADIKDNDLSRNPDLAGGKTDPAQWVQVADSSGKLLFTQPAAGTIVNDRLRSYFYNPGFQNWNLGLFKEFSITEQHKLLFRVEVFNFPNHPNWGGATSDPTSASFGKATSKSSERNVQFSMRYRF